MPLSPDYKGESLVDTSEWPSQTTMLDPREGMRIGLPAEVALRLRQALIEAGCYAQDVVRAQPSKDGSKTIFFVDLWHNLDPGVTYGTPTKSLINRRKEVFDTVVNKGVSNDGMLTTDTLAGKPNAVRCSSCGERQSLGTVLQGSAGKWLCRRCSDQPALVKRSRGRPKTR